MCRALRLALVLETFLAVVPTTSAQPSSGQELLDFVRDAHRASRESIRTCSCTVKFTSTLVSPRSDTPRTQTGSGRYWYSADAVRAQVSDLNQNVDYVWTGSVRSAVWRRSSAGEQQAGGTRSNAPSRYIPRCDAYMRGLLVVNVPTKGSEYVSFEQFVTQASRFRKAERRSVDGKEMLVVRFAFDRTENGTAWDVEIHFDPAVNYLVRKTIYLSYSDRGTFCREDEVLQFKECAPGVFFPERVAGRSGPQGNYDFNHNTVISDIRVNQPLPPDIFRLRYPEGVYLTDTIRGVQYRVDADGKRISPEERLERALPPPPLGAAGSLAPGTETAEEPRSHTRWILPIALTMLVLGGLGASVRRWRKRIAQS